MKMKRLADIESPFEDFDYSRDDDNDPFYSCNEEYEILKNLFHIDDLQILDEVEYENRHKPRFEEDPYWDFMGIDLPFIGFQPCTVSRISNTITLSIPGISL